MIDGGRTIDWGKSADDYALYRSGPPDSFYQKLYALGIGHSQQKILDLGTGTGILARHFAKQGAIVTAIDISAEQIAIAIDLTKKEELQINFSISPAEKTPFAANSFDIITANQCWIYFDKQQVAQEVKRLLDTNGLLLISSYHWLTQQSMIAIETEKLMFKYNPQWDAYNWNGNIQIDPPWIEEHFILRDWFYYDEAIPFTQEQWRGRIRASRAMMPTLTAEEVKKFDQEHELLLKQIADEQFFIPHRIYGRLVVPK